MLLNDRSKVLPPSATIAFLGILLAVSLLFNIGLFLRIQNIPDGIAQYFFPTSQSEQAKMLGFMEDNPEGKAIINGKVWKRIDEPMFNIIFLKDDSCANCVDVEAIKPQLEATFPTGNGRLVDVASDEGKELIEKGVTVVPAVLLSKQFDQTTAFKNLAQGGAIAPVGEEYYEFRTNGNKRILSSEQLPALEAADTGRLTIVAYVDYLAPELTPYLTQLIPAFIERFQDKVNFSFRPFVNNLPSVYAAEAVLCGVEATKIAEVRVPYIEAVQGIIAGKQEISQEMMGQISAKLAELTSMEGDVAECFNTHQRANQVSQSSAETQKLGINGAPAFFVGDRFLAGWQPGDIFLNTVQEVLVERNLTSPTPTPETAAMTVSPVASAALATPVASVMASPEVTAETSPVASPAAE